eukprot:COSAG05_NODE_8239_length_723_cov_1.264423_1_plen_24_part_10
MLLWEKHHLGDRIRPYQWDVEWRY